MSASLQRVRRPLAVVLALLAVLALALAWRAQGQRHASAVAEPTATQRAPEPELAPAELHGERAPADIAVARRTAEMQTTPSPLENAHLEVEAHLRRPGTVHGRVTDAAGLGLSAVLVRSVGMRREAWPPTMTAGDGRYSLKVLPSTAFRVEVLNERGGVLLKDAELRSLASGEELELDLRLGPTATVRGRALDTSGEPIAGLNVCLVPSKEEGAQLLPRGLGLLQDLQQTGPDGCFAFEGVPAGLYLLGPGEQPGDRDPLEETSAKRFESIVVGPAGGDIRCDLVVARGLWIAGCVRRADGSPAQGATVAGRRQDVKGTVETRSALDGTFRLGPLPSGPVELSAHHASELLAKERVVEAGAEGIELVLALRGAIEVEVRPPSRGFVRFIPRAENGKVLKTQVEDHLVFGGFPPGAYQVLVQTEDGHIGRARNIEVVGGGTVRAMIELEPGATLRLRGDASVSGASASLWDGEDWIDELTLSPDSAPSVLIPAGRPVRVELRAADEGWREEQTLTLASGEVREVPLASSD